MTDIGRLFAHSLPTGQDTTSWEPLAEHLSSVAERAAAFADVFGASRLARAAGLLHDIGKVADDYQAYIRGGRSKGPDHSTAGARAAVADYGAHGRLLAFAIAGHHSGLMDGTGFGGKGHSLDDRLDGAYAIPNYDVWSAYAQGLPSPEELRPDRRFDESPDYPGFSKAFLIRMLFSCLVDADFLETERFYTEADGLSPPARGGVLTQVHLDRIRAFMAAHRRDDTPVNRLRSEILDHANAKAALSPGLFTRTVPTGGGKTLTSLSFALEHARMHGLRRVVYVIPFTSIIEQTAQVFRDALKTGDILEHHASFDWDQRQEDVGDDTEEEGASGLAKLRRDAENWDAPIVVTTAVQFFESLFAARTSRARKLHNLAGSVIVLDEVQTLPVHLLRPCMAAIDELARNYGSTVVLCTATQPALRKQDGALPQRPQSRLVPGFDIGEERELAPRPRELYQALKRVDIEWRREPVDDATIVARFAEQDRMLCIVNTRRHARELFEAIRDLPGARHLTTLMCAKHRREVLDDVRADLRSGHAVRLVATSLIEAGVDVDFPEVWRAAAGLDSIAQAAGRCNREGKLEARGRTVIFEAAERKTPPAIEAFYDAAREVLRTGDDPLRLEAVHAYFRALYFNRGYEALDAAHRDRERYAILRGIENTQRKLDFPFSTIAQAFRLIDETMQPIFVPLDNEAERALKILRHAPIPPAKALRTLQQYVVPIPEGPRGAFLKSGAIQAIAPEIYGSRFLYLASMSLYDKVSGLRLDDPTWRSSENNVW